MKLITFISALLVMTLSLAGHASAQQGVTDDEILVGSATPLSGPAAIWGVASMAGARIRFEEANAKGGVHGRKIRLIVEDTQYQVPLAVRATSKLVDRDKVFAIFGSLGTPQNLATQDRLFQKQVPLMMPFTSAKAIQEPLEKYKFTWGSSYYEQVRAGIRYFHGKGRRNVCVMYQGTDYGAEVLQAAKDETSALGLEIVAEAAHKPTATEFVGTLTGFKSRGCDLVVMGTIIRDAIVGYATGRKLGMDADFFGNAASSDSIIAAQEGGITEGFYAFSSSTPPDPANMPRFFEAFQQATGRPAGNAAMFGYIWADIFVTGLENAGPNLTADSLVRGMEAIKNYQDPAGNPAFSYSASDHKGLQVVVPSVVKGGKFVALN